MGPLEQAKSELIRQFETLATTDQQSAIARLQTKMKLGVDLLAWMKGQLVYPQFYLRFRDEAKTVAAVGKVRSFFQMNSEPLLLNQAHLIQQKLKPRSHHFAVQLKLEAK